VTTQSITARAVNLLSRREHSQAELRAKLLKADFELNDIDATIEKLTQANIQSDARFAENYLRYRSQRGYGSQKIRLELKERGVDSDTITMAFEQAEIDWFELAMSARHKRFGEQVPENLKDRAKQQRFLQYRGFTHEQINESLNS
jgi:regulatory protein